MRAREGSSASACKVTRWPFARSKCLPASLAVLVGVLFAFASVPVRANGRYPLATQLVRAPNDASYLALRSTFGILQSFDTAVTWSWICEHAAGYSDIQDPTIALTGDGTLLVGSEGLRATRDRGCNFGAPNFPASSVTDLAVDPARPES